MPGPASRARISTAARPTLIRARRVNVEHRLDHDCTWRQKENRRESVCSPSVPEHDHRAARLWRPCASTVSRGRRMETCMLERTPGMRRVAAATTVVCMLAAGCGTSARTRTVDSGSSAKLAAAASTVVCMLPAGCGTASPTTGTVARRSSAKLATAATASRNAATESNPNRGRDYPRRFEVGFLTLCVDSATKKQCGCVLSTIESHATYATVVAEFQSSTFLLGPEYRYALRTCKVSEVSFS